MSQQRISQIVNQLNNKVNNLANLNKNYSIYELKIISKLIEKCPKFSPKPEITFK